MKIASKGLLVVICLYFLPFYIVNGQSKKELENRKEKQLQELQYSSSLLDETKENRERTINELLLVNKRIELREELVNNIQYELTTIEARIQDNNEIISSLQHDLENKQQEYEELILYAFKNRTKYSDFMYILAAESINEAYKRYSYLKQLTDYRKRQAELIIEIKRVLENKNMEMEVKKKEKEILLIQRKEEQASLQLEKEKKNEYVSELKNRERELKAEIRKKEEILANIESSIDKIIEAEAKKSESGNLYDRLTPRERIVSNEFSKNKGRLPWPTNKGIVTGKFGEHPHPVLSGVVIRNNGIDITTKGNAVVNSVFNGEVTLIAAIPGGNYAVIVRHGNFFTVYQNITKVKVKQGEKVVTNQPLGYVYSENKEGTGVLHFELRKEYDKLNPEDWLTM
ncbi:MAG: peptidoglycan DD-metalloendopeptidase family protein [Bacteroidetes bacterium]|jgi:septal ring factor EnvC (AmiA/AmiB activator)|nr:peptidoglycan DD-metalloendopeptidase family protein [Bacteroidota bacterium]